MRLGQFAGNAQAQTRARRSTIALRTVKSFKDVWRALDWDWFAIISHC